MIREIADAYRAGYADGIRHAPVLVAAPNEVQELRRRIAELQQAGYRTVDIWATRVNRLEDQMHAAGLVPYTEVPKES